MQLKMQHLGRKFFYLSIIIKSIALWIFYISFRNYSLEFCTPKFLTNPLKISDLFLPFYIFFLDIGESEDKSLDFYDLCLTVDEIRLGNTFTVGN